MQVIFRGACWLCFWAPLQRDEQVKDILSAISKKLEIIALDISNKGWKHSYSLVYFSILIIVKDHGLLFLLYPKLGCV